ncbi:MAG: 30S ribosomal protein S16 [Acidobacteria bacterium]|nr:30S ribosomal protein S16 [Acidobacteriota bacterium]
MLTIRLRRMGAKHKPVYRIVVSDSRKRPTSDILDQVGFYDPTVDPPEVRLDIDKVEAWRSKGAQMSETVRSLVRKAGKSQ